METYTIKLKRQFWFDKKLKNVKANLFPEDMNPGADHSFMEVNGKPVVRMLRKNPVKYMLVVFADERTLIVNMDKYQGHEISKDLFYIKAREIEKQSQGQAKVA